MKELISKEDIKNIIIEAIEFRFDEDTKNTILKSKSFDGEDQFIYKDLHLDSLDVIEEFNMSRCAAAGIGNKRGNNSDTDINPKSGVKYVPCDPNAHYTFDDMMYDFLN